MITAVGGLQAHTGSPRDLGSHESRDRNLLTPGAKKPPKSVASYVSVRSVYSRYHYRRESSPSARGTPNGAKAPSALMSTLGLRWSASRPGRPKCAAASHFQQKSWDAEIGYTSRRSHVVEKFWSEVRCRVVVLRASRISLCPRRPLARHAHSFHAKRRTTWPDLADLPPSLHRSQHLSVTPDGDAFLSIYSSPGLAH